MEMSHYTLLNIKHKWKKHDYICIKIFLISVFLHVYVHVGNDA